MTADALLAAVRADPDADLPRLVYADHLDDAGDPARAEFIRVQCELARLDDADPRRPALEDREHELLDAHEPAWLDDVPAEVEEWEWRRGFVDRLSVSDLFAPLDEFTAAHPVREVACGPNTDCPPDELAGRCRAWLSRIRSLDLSGWSWADSAEYAGLFAEDLLPDLSALGLSGIGPGSELHWLVAGSPLVRRLTRLRVDDSDLADVDCGRLLDAAPLTNLDLTVGLTGDGLWQLLAGSFASRLTALAVPANPFGADDWRVFGRLPADAALTRLSVFNTELGRSGLPPLLASRGLSRLTSLDAGYGHGPRAVYESLAASPFWSQAEQLRLYACEMSADDLAPLCQAVGSPQLELLDLSQNSFGPAGVRHLLTAGWGEVLTWLALSGNGVSDPPVTTLSQSGRFAVLRTLHLADNPITDVGAAAMAASPSLGQLRILTLSRTAVTDRSVPVLLDAPHWQLSGLGLAGCDLSERAVHALAASPRLRRLQWLDLSGNPRLGGDTLMPLAESPHLSRLCELDVGGVDASDRVRDALRQRLGRRLSD